MWTDGPNGNPMTRVWVKTLTEDPSKRISRSEATFFAKLIMFPVTLLMGAFGGADLATAIAEKGLAKVFLRVSARTMGVFAIILGYAAPFFAIWVILRGYEKSIWSLAESFLAKFL